MKEMICIVCPRGCHLTVGEAPDYPVAGNACPRGAVYAAEEIREPKRTVTATCPVAQRCAESPCGVETPCGASTPRRVPVKTDGGVLRESIPALMNDLMKTRVSLPVRSGDVIIENWKGSGVSVVATRDLG